MYKPGNPVLDCNEQSSWFIKDNLIGPLCSNQEEKKNNLNILVKVTIGLESINQDLHFLHFPKGQIRDDA